METVASRELRNHTAALLRKVAQGESLVVTVNGTAAAMLSPVISRRRQFLTKAESIALVFRHQADPGLALDLAELAGDTTDDLGPIR